jgi:DtxR family transcriptional regulator, Mn-dependent transcriptional regulator
MDKSLPLSPALQDYLEAIWQLVAEKGSAQAGEIAEALSVHKSTVTAALKKLSEKALVDYSPYHAVTLTAQGREVGREVARRHGLLSRFLTDVLSVEPGMADRNACRMEHILDREVVRRLRLFGEFVKSCPRVGEDWLKKFEDYVANDGQIRPDVPMLDRWLDRLKERLDKGSPEGGPVSAVSTLDKMKPGQSGTIVRVGRAAGAVCRRIVDMGVVRGTPIEVIKVAPLGDPIEVKVKGYSLSLRKVEAAAVLVEPN